MWVREEEWASDLVNTLGLTTAVTKTDTLILRTYISD